MNPLYYLAKIAAARKEVRDSINRHGLDMVLEVCNEYCREQQDNQKDRLSELWINHSKAIKKAIDEIGGRCYP